MLVFIIRRLIQAVLVMLTVSLLAFVLFRYIGDPVTIMLGQDATEQDRVELRASLGLDQPAPVQFARFVCQAVQGEFGLSLRQAQPVSTLLKDRLPATVGAVCGRGHSGLADRPATRRVHRLETQWLRGAKHSGLFPAWGFHYPLS